MAQAHSCADGTREHEDRQKDEWNIQQGDRRECGKQSERAGDRGLGDGTPEGYATHEEPREHRDANGANNGKLDGIKDVGDAT